MHPGRWTRRRWVAVGLCLGLSACGLVASIWPRDDPWPARLVTRPAGPVEWGGFAPDGRSFRTVGPGGLIARDLATGAPGPPVPVPKPDFWGMLRKRFSADGRRVAGWAGKDPFGEIVFVRDASTGAIEHEFSTRHARGFDLAFRRGDRALGAIMDNRPAGAVVITWDLTAGAESRRQVRGPEGNSTNPVAAPDGRTWAYDDRARDAVQLWDAVLDRPIGGPLRAPPASRNFWGWPGVALAFTPDGRTLLAGRGDGRVEFWDVPTGRLDRVVRLFPGGYTATHLDISPDGRTLIATGVILDTPSRFAAAWKGLYARATGVEYLDASRELAAFDLSTGRVVARADRTDFLAFSPDGRTVVTEDQDGTYSFRPLPD